MVLSTRSDKPGVKDIIEMHRFNICLVVVLSLSCSGVKAPNVSHEKYSMFAHEEYYDVTSFTKDTTDFK